MIRCLNLDWLEVYCEESVSHSPCDADFFRRSGYYVQERPYGTRQYEQMFTILDHFDQPMIEIRRAPKSDARVKGIFSPFSCHIRLTNRYCYSTDPIGLLRDFLARFDYTLNRIFRLDLCLDFERFDTGDRPQVFLDRYVKGVYSKINQANIFAAGCDRWDGRHWNSFAWGSPKSMVSTKMYNKTLELQQAHDKPYIRQAWFNAHLIDDALLGTRIADDGTTYKPDIWRLEFSIKSPKRAHYIIENNHHRKTKLQSMPHTLSCYDTHDKRLGIFFSLADHYFHFKHFEEGKRKDRCPDKQLFRFRLGDQYYRLDALASSRPNQQPTLSLLNRLSLLHLTTFERNTRAAIEHVMEYLREVLARTLTEDGQSRLGATAWVKLIRLRQENKLRELRDIKQQDLFDALFPPTPADEEAVQ